MAHARNGELPEPDLNCDPVQRRWWLLLQAMADLPLPEAIALAHRAEVFLTQGTGERMPDADAAERDLPTADLRALPGPGFRKDELAQPAPSPADQKPEARNFPLGGIDRQTLFARLAQGATNAELAKEFGLTQRQVQGFRMQMARPKPAEASPAADEVVRFLRQQGDVVVGAGENQFIVNGRFRLTLEELIERANRMRARQGKQLFTNVAPSRLSVS